MHEVTFVTADSLIASIQEDLASYDANNQLDPGRWYPWIQKVVSDLGVACYEYKHALIWIKDFKGHIECDFNVLESAFWVSEHCHGGQGVAPVHYQGRSVIWDDTTVAKAKVIPGCGGCEFGTCTIDELPNQITVREYIQGLPYLYEYNILRPLAVNERNARAWCLPRSICFGSHSKEEITISKGEMYTNFCDGIVLLNYYAYPYDDRGLPMIPDNPKVQLAIEHYVKWKIFELLWTNNDDLAVETKMKYWQNEFRTESYPDAEYYMKLTSFNDMVDIVRNDRKRFNHFQLTQK